RDPRRRGHGLRRADDGRERRPGARRAALRLVHGQARLFQGARLVSLRLELADHGDPEGAEDPDLPSRRGPAPAARRGRPPREEEAALGATRRPVLVSLAIRPEGVPCYAPLSSAPVPRRPTRGGAARRRCSRSTTSASSWTPGRASARSSSRQACGPTTGRASSSPTTTRITRSTW